MTIVQMDVDLMSESEKKERKERAEE